MAITDNVGYVKLAMAGLLTLLAAPSAAFAESKFLSLKIFVVLVTVLISVGAAAEQRKVWVNVSLECAPNTRCVQGADGSVYVLAGVQPNLRSTLVEDRDTIQSFEAATAKKKRDDDKIKKAVKTAD